MRAVIPFDASDPKRRLQPVLDPEERAAFAQAMLEDLLAAVADADLEPTVLATEPLPSLSVPVRVDDRPLDAAVNAAIEEATPLAVLVADLPLVESATLDRLLATPGDVVLAPGRGGGTNAMVVRDSAFATDYHGASIRDHRALARERGLSVAELDSFRLGTDVDEPADLIEVLLHGGAHSRRWLQAAGFQIQAKEGRATVRRVGDSD
mgnify:CR=1 FL=1